MFLCLGKRRCQQTEKLSGEELQMLAMGRALIFDPDLLLLDEPSADLSPRIVKNIFQQIKAINQMGNAIVLVEQNVKKALLIADRDFFFNGCDRLKGSGGSLLDNLKVSRLYLDVAHQES